MYRQLFGTKKKPRYILKSWNNGDMVFGLTSFGKQHLGWIRKLLPENCLSKLAWVQKMRYKTSCLFPLLAKYKAKYKILVLKFPRKKIWPLKTLLSDGTPEERFQASINLYYHRFHKLIYLLSQLILVKIQNSGMFDS